MAVLSSFAQVLGTSEINNRFIKYSTLQPSHHIGSRSVSFTQLTSLFFRANTQYSNLPRFEMKTLRVTPAAVVSRAADSDFSLFSNILTLWCNLDSVKTNLYSNQVVLGNISPLLDSTIYWYILRCYSQKGDVYTGWFGPFAGR